jgi:hypothetical protein
MNEADRQARNVQRLSELFPTFAVRIQGLIVELEGQGLRPRIQDAWRSPADQVEAYLSGHSKLKYGFHNVTGPNGERQGLAVDLLDDDFPAHEGSEYLLHLAAAAARRACVTGVRWGLPLKLRAAIDEAIATSDWGAAVKIGWDPAHVQPVDLTVAEAKAGRRPA